MSGDIWYVYSVTGVDAAAPRGLDATRPLATIEQAQTNASNGDIILCLSGHTETLMLTISKQLTIVGAGQSSGKPTVKLTPSTNAALACVTVDAVGTELRNLWIEERTGASATARMTVSAANFRMVDCYIECGATDTGPALELASGANSAQIVNTTFISTATALASQPESAITVSAAISDLLMDGVVFSNSTYGFSNPYAFVASASAITRLRAQSVSLLLGADATIHASTTGWMNPQTVTGGSRVLW